MTNYDKEMLEMLKNVAGYMAKIVEKELLQDCVLKPDIVFKKMTALIDKVENKKLAA